MMTTVTACAMNAALEPDQVPDVQLIKADPGHPSLLWPLIWQTVQTVDNIHSFSLIQSCSIHQKRALESSPQRQ